MLRLTSGHHSSGFDRPIAKVLQIGRFIREILVPVWGALRGQNRLRELFQRSHDIDKVLDYTISHCLLDFFF